jgi:hypothetical protein
VVEGLPQQIAHVEVVKINACDTPFFHNTQSRRDTPGNASGTFGASFGASNGAFPVSREFPRYCETIHRLLTTPLTASNRQMVGNEWKLHFLGEVFGIFSKLTYPILWNSQFANEERDKSDTKLFSKVPASNIPFDHSFMG